MLKYRRNLGCQEVAFRTLMIRGKALERIQADIYEKYPNLHAFTNEEGLIEVAGVFPVYGVDREVLDCYTVSITLPENFPRKLPIVYEVGGRIPRKPDYHINPDGSACVFLPDDRWRCFPVDASFIDYLNGPLHNFFLSQTYYAVKKQWPFGEWKHGVGGLYEYYQWLIRTDDKVTIARFLHLLRKNNLKKHYDCPCGSGKVVKKCCVEIIKDLRSKITPEVATKAMNNLGFDNFPPPYKRSRLRDNYCWKI